MSVRFFTWFHCFFFVLLFSFVKAVGVCFLAVCKGTYPAVLVFCFLEELQREFMTTFQGHDVQRAKRPYSFIEFGKQDYNNLFLFWEWLDNKFIVIIVNLSAWSFNWHRHEWWLHKMRTKMNEWINLNKINQRWNVIEGSLFTCHAVDYRPEWHYSQSYWFPLYLKVKKTFWEVYYWIFA